MKTNLMLATCLSHGLLAIRAEAPANDDEVLTAIAALRAATDARFAALEEESNRAAVIAAARALNGPGGNVEAVDTEYTASFNSYARSGAAEADLRAANKTGDRAAIQAALSEGTNSDGGYLAPTEWDRTISQALVSVSPMRRLSDVRKTKVGAYSKLWKLTGPGTGWVGETASRPATATPGFAQIIFGHGEIYANAFATQRILDDADMDLEGWLTDEVDTEFAKQEAIAFLTGDGVNKPYGLLLYGTGGAHAAVHPAGAITVVASGNATGLTVDGLIDFVYGLAAPYRQNASWLMNSNTAAYLAKVKDGQGNLIWRESLAAGQPSTLLGRPVEIDENMPNIAAGTTPIIFGDFKAGYLINDRKGTTLLRDPYTAKPFVAFYLTRRVGGGVKDPNAFRILKIAAA
ncbi:phage major capsid protein [Sphingobium sp.]|uniref:phage major capsid protein n=1 Tax=Sphingobium sp. TaxID=1912891 RepID=UPI003BB580DC